MPGRGSLDHVHHFCLQKNEKYHHLEIIQHLPLCPTPSWFLTRGLISETEKTETQRHEEVFLT